MRKRDLLLLIPITVFLRKSMREQEKQNNEGLKKDKVSGLFLQNIGTLLLPVQDVGHDFLDRWRFIPNELNENTMNHSISQKQKRNVCKMQASLKS